MVDGREVSGKDQGHDGLAVGSGDLLIDFRVHVILNHTPILHPEPEPLLQNADGLVDPSISDA